MGLCRDGRAVASGVERRRPDVITASAGSTIGDGLERGGRRGRNHEQDNIRRLIDAGLVPSRDTGRGSVSVGWGRTCDVCETQIAPDQRAQDLEFWDTILVRLHAECAELYEMELRRRSRQTP
jgi:hypothetical protein